MWATVRNSSVLIWQTPIAILGNTLQECKQRKSWVNDSQKHALFTYMASVITWSILRLCCPCPATSHYLISLYWLWHNCYGCYGSANQIAHSLKTKTNKQKTLRRFYIDFKYSGILYQCKWSQASVFNIVVSLMANTWLVGCQSKEYFYSNFKKKC